MKKPKIIVIADNNILSAVMKETLTELNCEVDIVKSGHNALGILKPEKYDLIFTDIELGDMQGYEVVKSYRQREAQVGKCLHTPILCISSLEGPSHYAKCIYAGMDEVITNIGIGGREALEKILKKYIKPKNMI